MIMNYCVFFVAFKTAIELPIKYEAHTSEVRKYIDSKMGFLDDLGIEYDYTSVENVVKWGYELILTNH